MIDDSFPMTVEQFDSFWNDLVIHYAAYGHDEIFMDVTQKLRSLVHDNRLHERIDDPLFPIDPVKRQLKDLVVVYSHGTTRCQKVQVKQRQFLTLPLSADDLKTHKLSGSVMQHLLVIAAQDDKEIAARILIVEIGAFSRLDAPAEPYCTCQMTLLNTSSFDLRLEGIEGSITCAGDPLSRAPELVEDQSVDLSHAGHLRISLRQWVTKSFADEFGNKRFELDTAFLSVHLSYCNHEGVHRDVKKSIRGYRFTVDPIDRN